LSSGNIGAQGCDKGITFRRTGAWDFDDLSRRILDSITITSSGGIYSCLETKLGYQIGVDPAPDQGSWCTRHGCNKKRKDNESSADELHCSRVGESEWVQKMNGSVELKEWRVLRLALVRKERKSTLSRGKKKEVGDEREAVIKF
jgi:hypothetical protein